MESEKYCPLVSCRNGGGHGISDWVKCLGNRCMFFNSEIEKCSVWMNSNSLGRNIGGSKLEEHEGRDVKK